MRCLLDTHTFLWFIGRHPAIPSAIRELIEQPTTLRFLSIASLWEMAIKINAGKLAIGMRKTGYPLATSAILTSLDEHQIVRVAMLDQLLGCPHEEEIDAPDFLVVSFSLSGHTPHGFGVRRPARRR